MNQTELSSRSDNPGGEESAESPAADHGKEPAPPSSHSPVSPSTPLPFTPPRDALNDMDDEKDVQDRLTPAALVQAASGVQLLCVRNPGDLEKGVTLDDVDVTEQVDKVLAAVPPTLERQPVMPSQPGAFRAEGALLRNDDESVMSLGNSSAPPTGLIEATLVEEDAPTAAPVYKGQIVLEDDDQQDNKIAELDKNVVTLRKSYVGCFVLAFAILLITTVVGVFVTIKDETSASDTDPTSSPTKERKKDEKFETKNRYWYQNQPPQKLWEKLENYAYVSHHMAIVSIINPTISIINPQSYYREAICSPVLSDRGFGTGYSQGRLLRYQESRSLETDATGPVVEVTFTCGSNPAAAVTTMLNGTADTMILFHDADVNDVGLNSVFIGCKDGRQPNTVICGIPSTNGGFFSFLFSCFSQTEELAAVASVATHNVSVYCIVSQSNNFTTFENDDDVEEKLPEIFVNSPAAIVLSTQRLCRESGGNGFVLQDSLLNRRNLTDACLGNGVRRDSANVPLCLSEAMSANTTYPLEERMFCPYGSTEACFVADFRLPNVTLFDPWNWSEDGEDCSFGGSVNESLVVQSPNETVYPVVPLVNSSTLQQLQVFLQAQEVWVQEEVLDQNNT